MSYSFAPIDLCNRCAPIHSCSNKMSGMLLLCSFLDILSTYCRWRRVECTLKIRIDLIVRWEILLAIEIVIFKIPRKGNIAIVRGFRAAERGKWRKDSRLRCNRARIFYFHPRAVEKNSISPRARLLTILLKRQKMWRVDRYVKRGNNLKDEHAFADCASRATGIPSERGGRLDLGNSAFPTTCWPDLSLSPPACLRIL